MVTVILHYGENFSAGIKSLGSVSRIQILPLAYLCGLELLRGLNEIMPGKGSALGLPHSKWAINVSCYWHSSVVT